jgi:ubiquinone/menaquinone biosynthesis C-methylase UbiE
MTMIRQRPDNSAPAAQSVAEQLPLTDTSMDASLAVLTLHHWRDPFRGLAEMRRVARKQVMVLTWDPSVWETFWLIRDCFPCIDNLDQARTLSVTK